MGLHSGHVDLPVFPFIYGEPWEPENQQPEKNTPSRAVAYRKQVQVAVQQSDFTNRYFNKKVIPGGVI
jgi:hypothetical protein